MYSIFNISRSCHLGLRILHRFFTWLPDRLFLKIKFKFEMGHSLNLEDPKTFQEKIQWLKLFNRQPEYILMVDKVAVKDYVERKIGKEYIIPTLGVWNSPEEIDFNLLPDKFVLKTSHGGGGGGVVICKNRINFNIDSAKRKLQHSLDTDIYTYFREWPYKKVPKRILAEEFIEIPRKQDLTDYKIFCFNGVPRYIQVIQDRNTKETIDFFDTEWNHQDFYGLNPLDRMIATQAEKPIEKPTKLSEMLEIASKLSADIPFVRVDLYHTDEKVYFGELTFFPASGLGTFTPLVWNTILGEMINIENIME